MSTRILGGHAPQASPDWLKRYYVLRFAVGALWVLLAFTAAATSPPLAAVLLVAYPAWDALANYLDAHQSGGLRRNRVQLLNAVFSAAVAVAVLVALGKGASAVLIVFAVWATVTGLLQLAAGLARWKTASGQWPMVLSGAQSALVGVLFVKMANAPHPVAVTSIAGYAALGAVYFLIAAVWQAVTDARRRTARAGT